MARSKVLKKEKKDTNWIYGLKILAAFCVVLHHYALYFFPAFINGNAEASIIKGALEVKIAHTPFNIFSWGGNVCVSIFFIISGFLIYYKFFYHKVDLEESLIKRYLRLSLPILFSSIIYFIILLVFLIKKDALICSNVLGKVGGYCKYEYSVFHLFWDSFFGYFIDGSTKISPILWTMKWELCGSFCTLLLSSILINSKHKKIIYLVVILLLYQTLLLPFILGMIICEIYLNNKYDKILSNKFLKFLLLILGIYFSGFTFEAYTTKWYSFLKLNLRDSLAFYHSVGAFMIILVITKSSILKKLLSFNIYKKDTNLSFSIYLFHWLILNTFSMTMMNILLRSLNYKYSFIIMFVVSFTIIILVSHFCGELVMKLTGETTNKIYNKFFNEKN